MKTRILAPTKENIALCAAQIRDGGVVAFPTETVYGLGADARNERAVPEIFRIKGRPSDNPLIVHVATFAEVRQVAQGISPLAERLMLRFMPGPLTLVFRKQNGIPDCVTAGLPTVGVRMPSNPVAREFLRACGCPVCAPSANTSTRPSPTCAEHVRADLDGKLPYVLDGGDCEVGVESTILDVCGVTPRLLRAGGISREDLERVCGMPVETVTSSKVALCPGMKYKHYAPKATVLFSAYYADMAANVAARYDALVKEGKRPVILGTDAWLGVYGTRAVYRMGADSASYAHCLFAALRKADAEGYDTVLAEGVADEGVGAAIINRLVKSSGGNII